jgi:hypothetical protein
MDVRKLQEDLRTTGFLLVGTPDGVVGPRTEMAIREFQRYARMPQVAKEDTTIAGPLISRLTSVINDFPYTGIAHGEADDQTLQKLAHWIGEDWRCPVVIQAWRLKKGAAGAKCDKAREPADVESGRDNIWDFDEVRDKAPRIYAYDFSGYFTSLAPGTPPPRVVVGTFLTSNGMGDGPFAGPPHHVWLGGLASQGMEVRPKALLGKELGELSVEERSTFKVVRAVSEVECLGFFDSVNAWDQALMSIGLYNWTLGGEWRIRAAELAAYFAYLKFVDPVTFDKCVGAWGVEPGRLWKDTFDPNQRKYVSEFYHQTMGDPVPIPDTMADFYRSWHWFYRFQASARYVEAFRRRMWDMARFRIRDILETPITRFTGSPVAEGTKLSQVYTSERATAFLLRWHILSPKGVVDGGESGLHVNAALRTTNNPPLPPDPATWKDCHEHRLVEGLLKEVNRLGGKKAEKSELNKTISELNTWPSWARNPTSARVNPRCYQLEPTIGGLSQDRGSFKFDRPTLDEIAKRGIAGTETETSAEDGLLAAPDDAHLRAVLYAYEGQATPEGEEVQPTFRVMSNGTSLTATYNDQPATAPPDLNAIDRVVLFAPDNFAGNEQDPEDALFALALVPGSLRQLVLEKPGTQDSRLSIKGQFRCWLPHDDGEETQVFEFWVRHRFSIVTELEFERIRFERFADEGAITFRELRDKGHRFKDGPAPSFDRPALAERLGIQRLATDLTKRFERRITFEAVPLAGDSACAFPKHAGRSSSPRRFIQIEMEVALKRDDNQRHEIRPYPLTFLSNDMPVKDDTDSTVMVATARQPFGEIWRKPFGFQWMFDLQFPQIAALDFWNTSVVDPVVQSLGVVQQGRPASLFPRFTQSALQGRPVWQARYLVIDLLRSPKVKQSVIDIGSAGDTAAAGKITVFPRLLTPALGEETDQDARAVDSALPGLRTTGPDGKGLLCRLELNRRDDDETQPVGAPNIRFGVRHRVPGLAADQLQTVRMGALDLTFPPGVGAGEPDEPHESLLLATLQKGPQGLSLVGAREIEYSLKLNGVNAGGEDDIPGDEFDQDLGATMASSMDYRDAFARRPALLWPVAPAAVGQSPFFLTVREVISPGRSQTIDLRLRSTQGPAGLFAKAEVIVVDPEPFLIAKVTTGETAGTLAATDEIGNWTNAADVGSGWEICAGATGFDLVLPPQGVGETMHRRVDSHDIEPEMTDNGYRFPPADFRFTPTTNATLRASFFKQRFAEPPWNLRRILGYPGQRAPGAGVDRVRFELLYGMSGEITYPFLRLSEIGARLGRVSGQQPPALTWLFSTPQCRQYVASRNLWRELYAELRTRLAVLEPYDTNQPRQLVLRAEDGLSYRLRTNAELKYPILGARPHDGVTVPVEGLAGSFAWAFESRNIYDAIWRVPIADTAQLGRPYFSSLGGWAHQKATFDNRRTTIYAEVAMGRASTLNVERIGRIGVYWNRAKHVIVYERTVAPSRQFFLEQYPLLGNPVLRKVDEYIELLEEERRFPDSDEAALTSGPVTACRFSGGKPPRIRVNSRWGEDIGDTGWKIPLWLRGAAPADVYPKPSIHLLGRGIDSGEFVPIPIDEPEKLYFYANTEPALGDDTNAWPAVSGVDFQVLPKAALTPPAANSANDVGSFTAGDQFFKDGASAFTVSLAPGPKPVDVVSGRSPTPVAAALRNVTMMRGVAIQEVDDGPDGELAKAFQNIARLEQTLGNALAPILAMIPADPNPFDSKDLTGLFKPAIEALTELRALAMPLVNAIDITKEIEELRNRINSQIGFFSAELRYEVPAAIWRLYGDLLQTLADLQKEFPDFSNKDVKPELIRRWEALLDEGEASAGYRTFLSSLPGTVGSILTQLERTVDRVGLQTAEVRRTTSDNECEI